MKTAMCEKKSTLVGSSSRLEIMEEKISRFENSSINYSKIKKEEVKINQQSTSELWGEN